MKLLHRLPLFVLLASSLPLSQLGACGGDDDSSDSGSASGNDGPSSGDDDGHSHDDDGDDDGHAHDDDGDDGDDGAQSECSSPADCENVVCDCPDGPVNWTYCDIVNDIGRCGTEETCVEDGACD